MDDSGERGTINKRFKGVAKQTAEDGRTVRRIDGITHVVETTSKFPKFVLSKMTASEFSNLPLDKKHDILLIWKHGCRPDRAKEIEAEFQHSIRDYWGKDLNNLNINDSLRFHLETKLRMETRHRTYLSEIKRGTLFLGGDMKTDEGQMYGGRGGKRYK